MENGFVIAVFLLNLFVFLQMSLKSEWFNQLGPIDLLSILVNHRQCGLIVVDPD